MNKKNIGAGALITRRIEELLQNSTLPPETVLTIMRTAQAKPDYDPLKEFERLQREKHHSQ